MSARAPAAASTPTLATAGIGFIIGFVSLAGVSSPWDKAPAFGTSAMAILLAILARNVPAVFLLYSGVVTAGFSSFLAAFMLSTYVGATFAAAASNIGTQAALTSIALYAPIEFAALLLATFAGFTPVATWATRPDGTRPLAAYLAGLRASLVPLGAALVTVLVAGGAETLVITTRMAT